MSDARSVGARVDDDDADFARSHEATCRECSVESAVWRSFAAAAGDSPDESGAHVGQTWPGSPSTPALVDRVLAAAEHDAAPPAPGPSLVSRPAPRRISPHVRRIGVMTLGLAVAAGAVVAFRAHRHPALPIAGGPAPAPPPVATPPTPAEPPERAAVSIVTEAAPGYRCDTPVDDVTVCVADGAHVRARDPVGARQILDLREGRVVVALGPRSRSATVVVTTPSGHVTAAAATFSVAVDGSGATWARVEHGSIHASRAGAKTASAVAAGQELRLDIASRPRALPLAERSTDLTVLAMEVAASEAPVISGPTPIPAEHRSAPPETTPREGVTIDADSPADVSAMLARARSLFGRGAFADAAQAYEAAYQAAPASPEGRAALVSLGDLRLSELADPRGALSAFDGYLGGGGVLAAEAEFGRIGALRALGRRDDERAAARAFLQAHPTGPRSDALRRRLEN